LQIKILTHCFGFVKRHKNRLLTEYLVQKMEDENQKTKFTQYENQPIEIGRPIRL